MNCRRKQSLTVACVILLALGVLGIVRASTGEPTDPWYLIGAASVTSLLLPLIATPMTWVAVEVLVKQTRASDAASELATDTAAADIGLQSQERSDPHTRPDGDISNTCDQTPSLNAAHTVDTMERDISSNDTAVLNARTLEAAVNGHTTSAVEYHLSQQPQSTTEHKSQHALSVEPKVNAAQVEQYRSSNRRPTAELKARHVQFLEAEVYDVQPHRIDRSKFQSLNKAACAVVYIAVMCFSLSILCLMWNIFIGARYNEQQDYYWPSIVCHTVLNILCPVFSIVGLFLVLSAVTYISSGQVDFRVIFCYLLASVKIVNGEMLHPPEFTFKFWVIANHFYLRLRSPRGNPKQLRYYIDHTPATYVLAAFVCLAFTAAAWLFLEMILVKRLTVTTPVTEEDCSGYTCVYGLAPMTCHEVAHLNITDKVMLHCTLFHFEYNILISSYELIVAVLVYIGAVQLLKITVFLAAILLLIYTKPSSGVCYF